MRASKREIAFDTVACDKANSAAARAKEPVSATLAKMAHASKSGSFFMFYGIDQSASILFVTLTAYKKTHPAQASVIQDGAAFLAPDPPTMERMEFHFFYFYHT
ncbi:hypothetical protein [Thauera sp. Sel9]|uniref:hypothetical protein n=1 Tax=Thauera sp. Sel9 TaxID=2974299 RepID=UPI0021E190D7|nr:hypothetical protein [Thauera sp. Sel9]MCV2216900.1 hypothetical protein [Thauera sp. Sel9]